MDYLTKLVEGASIPELKEAIDSFKQDVLVVTNYPKIFPESRAGLRGVVKGVCEAFQECRVILEELLGGDEDAEEELSRSWVLDRSQEEEEDFELEMVRIKSKKNGKRKRDIHSSPPKPTKVKKVKSIIIDSTQRNGKRKPLLPKSIPSWWPDISIVQKKSNTSSSSPAPPSSEQKRKRTIEEIFEADRQRREGEALKEAERRRHEAEIRAKCAQCKAHFLTDENWDASCVFHPGTMRRYHPAYRSYNRRWFCCGTRSWNPGCMEARHIDDRILGELERLQAIGESALEEAQNVVYRNREECERDVEVESDIEDEIEEPETEEEEVEVQEEEGEEEEEKEEESEVSDKKDPPPVDSVFSEDHHPFPDQKVPPTEEDPEVIARGILDWVTLRNPIENTSSPSPDRFLCDSCEEKAAVSVLQCIMCLRLYERSFQPLEDDLCPECKAEEENEESDA